MLVQVKLHPSFGTQENISGCYSLALSLSKTHSHEMMMFLTMVVSAFPQSDSENVKGLQRFEILNDAGNFNVQHGNRSFGRLNFF